MHAGCLAKPRSAGCAGGPTRPMWHARPCVQTLIVAETKPGAAPWSHCVVIRFARSLFVWPTLKEMRWRPPQVVCGASALARSLLFAWPRLRPARWWPNQIVHGTSNFVRS